MPKQTIYTVGGTVQAGEGIYIKRQADDDLLELCRRREFAFILSSRQVGKSSLIVRTAQQLEKENIRSATIDLSAIGVKVSQNEWYLGILNEIQVGLDLQTDIFTWWEQYSWLGPAQRMTNFFRDVLLKEVSEQVVLFFDEIDSTLSIPFSDDFYVAIRGVYNARSITSDFKRLSFVLAGVAEPSDLISDTKRTPFNVGEKVELNDFTLDEALPLVNGLGEEPQQFLEWIFKYTNGHPYLTQRLCAHLARSQDHLDEQAVAKVVGELFTGEQAKQADSNLQFVRDMLAERSPDITKVLLIYRDIRAGKSVLDDERSIPKSHLKLSGLVRSRNGILQVRNEIYNRVFDLDWVKEKTPKNVQKLAIIGLSVTLVILILGILGIFINDYFVGTRIDKSFRSFISTTDPRRRLADLAEIYRQKGILSNQNTDLTASQLFYKNLFTLDDQINLFLIPAKSFSSDSIERIDVNNDLIVVIDHLYSTVANVNGEPDNTGLLEAMLAAISTVENNEKASRLKETLAAWIEARKSYAGNNYAVALDYYNKAILTDLSNRAIRFERAKVYIELAQYEDALSDLESTLGAAQETRSDSNTSSVASATASVTEAPAGQPSQPTMQITPLPVGGTRTPVAESTSITDNTPIPNPIPDTTFQSFESTFTTYSEIVNAIQVVIQGNSGLQSSLRSDSSAFKNLQEAGLVNFTSEPAADLRTDILNRGYILIATDANYEPQSFVKAQGQPLSNTSCPNEARTSAELQGFDVDVANALGQALGVETCFVTPSWDAVTGGNWQDQWDISIGSMTITKTRQQIFDFSIPYYFIPTVVAVRTNSGISDLADLEGQSLCVVANSLQESWLNHDLDSLDLPVSSIYQEVSNVTAVTLRTDQECAQTLEGGTNKFVGYVGSESVVDFSIAAGFPLTKLTPPVLSQEIAAAFDKKSSISSDTLRAEVNKLFNAMHTDGRLSKLSIKWYGVDLTMQPEVDVVQTATPQPTSTPGPVIAQIPLDFPGTFIRVRQYPDLNSIVVGSVQAGDQVLVTAYTSNGWTWYQLDVPTREIEGAWISGIIALGGKTYTSVTASTDIRSNVRFIPLEDIEKP